MKEDTPTADDSPELHSGKGVRMHLNSTSLTWLAETVAAINEAWDAADTTKDAFDLLRAKWGTYVSDKQYGDRTWRAMPHRTEDELRLTVVLKGARLALDFREWYLPH
jgi:hypothetical protein